jgi:hypothetical protein
MRFYRTTLLVSAFSWLMIGMHLPALHEVTHHGAEVLVTVVVAVFTLGAVGVASLWALLHAPASKQARTPSAT